MHHLRLIGHFIRIGFLNLIAYPLNFWISVLHAVLSFSTSVMGVYILFSQVETIRGWSFASTLALLGTYLTLSALGSLAISPSLEALSGMDGEIWSGKFDFTLLRPVDVQFYASLQHWRLFRLFDLFLGCGVLIIAAVQLGTELTTLRLIVFLLMLFVALVTLYSILLAFSALVFWSPDFLFTWLFNALFQMARYPVGIYPGWLRLLLTWIIPVGVMTTVPAQALTGGLPAGTLFGSLVLALVFGMGATLLFRTGVQQYASASS
ncbi:MAG: ABC-2 family transporter protein [Anaerolineae bacterium]|nr:ABC-2 family transporter protein [Anaerolineae bacterium]